jgi:hypothetical protein
MTGTDVGGIMPNSVTIMVTYSAGIASYFRFKSPRRGTLCRHVHHHSASRQGCSLSQARSTTCSAACPACHLAQSAAHLPARERPMRAATIYVRQYVRVPQLVVCDGVELHALVELE